MGTSPLRSRSTRCSAGYRCVRFPVVATRRLGISSGMGTWSACSATSEPSGEPFPGRFSLRLTFAPGSHPRRERGPPSQFPLRPRLVAPESDTTVPFVLLARDTGESGRGFPDAELPGRSDDLVSPLISQERDSRFEAGPRAVVRARTPLEDRRGSRHDGCRRDSALQGGDLGPWFEAPEAVGPEAELLAERADVRLAGHRW